MLSFDERSKLKVQVQYLDTYLSDIHLRYSAVIFKILISAYFYTLDIITE